jgi:hypothetical protein
MMTASGQTGRELESDVGIALTLNLQVGFQHHQSPAFSGPTMTHWMTRVLHFCLLVPISILEAESDQSALRSVNGDGNGR